MHPCDERRSVSDLMADESDVEEDCLKTFSKIPFSRLYNGCDLHSQRKHVSSGFVPNPTVSLSSFITTSEPDMKNRILFTHKKCLLCISQRLPFLCAPQGRLSRLTIVGRSVKAHAGMPSSPPRPSQRKMTEAFGPGVDWPIHLSCNHP